ncbi:hypothetical protein AVEN_128318-1 [Araneus ventricosus]|uniref:Uncharacterized protein n=1 Tax=Araneus ventricosus TaxID=182803 RepID=A0A4Y2JLQ7_ARAVE|nr:hypothetical protein AVEN_128318-1 [Araneus ventricosus]
MNYFSVIRPPAGQITQPQSCAFFPGDDWKQSTSDTGRLCRLHVCGLLKRYHAPSLDPSRLCVRPGSFIIPFYDSYVSSPASAGDSLYGPLSWGKR